jgi:hypothetical protein
MFDMSVEQRPLKNWILNAATQRFFKNYIPAQLMTHL